MTPANPNAREPAAQPSRTTGHVQTVLGPVELDQLGRTYMHEHIFTRTIDVQRNYPGEWGSDHDRIEQAVAKLSELPERGIRTLVDLTVIGLGRDIPLLEKVAVQVPQLNIIVATGIYTYDSVPFFFRHREARHGRTDPMTALFISDIQDGIADTAVRAAMLKCAIDEPGLTVGVERVLRAVAQAHLATGAPITVHTHPGSETGHDVARVLCDEEGVSPQRVVLAHSGDSTDCDYLSRLAERGFVLGMDRFGLDLTPTFEQRADTVAEMCQRGYAGQMVLSQDAACYIDWLEPAAAHKLFPNWNYLHVVDHLVPYLARNGVSDRDIDDMLVQTPRRLLAQGPPSERS